MAKVKRTSSFDALNKTFKELDAVTGHVGWLNTAHYASGQPIAYIASIHEFGAASRNILPRPFMRPTIAEKRDEWNRLFERGIKAILRGKETAHSVMEKIVSRATGDVQKTISDLWTPALKEATVKARARRRHSKEITESLRKPLIDSGMMFQSISYRVDEE